MKEVGHAPGFILDKLEEIPLEQSKFAQIDFGEVVN